jgi:hypothetical protein
MRPGLELMKPIIEHKHKSVACLDEVFPQAGTSLTTYELGHKAEITACLQRHNLRPFLFGAISSYVLCFAYKYCIGRWVRSSCSSGCEMRSFKDFVSA